MELISPISKEWLVYFDIGNREPFQRLYKTRSHAASAITNYKNKIYYYRYNKSVKLPMKFITYHWENNEWNKFKEEEYVL
jgi:hypothetical protein